MILSATSPLLNTFDPVSLEEMDRIRFMDRIDTKFVFPAALLPALLEKLTENYKILEIDQQRSFKYDTRYFDTASFLFYNQHVRGKLARYKVRCRRYEATGGEFFEIKMKTNKGRTKKWRIRSDFNSNVIDGEVSEFIEKHIPYNILPLVPVLVNKFSRITLAGTCTNERITLDHNISFSTMNGGYAELPFMAIAELKSEGFYKHSPFITAARKIRIRPAGFSKYCVGLAMLMDMPRKNTLKPKLLLLKKIENEYSNPDFS